jgi:hypothetical protein
MAAKTKAGQSEKSTRPEKVAKKNRVEYEMILDWSAKGKPFKLQKLTFFAGKTFKSAYREAVAIKNLLRSAGGYKPGDVKLQAFGLVGVLQAHNQEHGIFARKHIQAITKLVKKAKRLQLNGKIKDKPIKRGPIDQILRTRS